MYGENYMAIQTINSFKLLIAAWSILASTIIFSTHKIVIQVSPPRCLSTAALRMWQARCDFMVLNEPFTSAFVFTTQNTHTLPSNWCHENAPHTFEEVLQKILLMAESGPVFVKEESYALVDYLKSNPSLMQNANVHFIFLVRNPHDALSSYYKNHKKIFDNFSYLAGFEQCYKIFKMVQVYGAHKPIIICAEDLYSKPYETAQCMCTTLNIPFLERMLQWEDLGDSFTGITEWGEVKNPELTHYWHGAAINSTTFHKPNSYEVDAQGNPTFSEVKNDADRQACFDAYYYNKAYYDLLLAEKAIPERNK